MLKALQEKNKGLKLFDIDDPALRRYGRKVTGIAFDEIIEDAAQFEISDGVRYQASSDILESVTQRLIDLQHHVYGDMPVQIGICWGKSRKLNGLEWHKGSEVIIAATDSVLLIAAYSDFEEKDSKLAIDTKKVVGLYLKKGDAVELYPMVLHLAPCQVSDQGFRDIIVLPRGTNERLDGAAATPLLTAKNKWMVGHPEANGRNIALYGENIEVHY